MHPDIERFYLNKPEPIRSCLLALREEILAHDKRFTETWKYRMPVFCIDKKMVCYLWISKKTLLPYVGIVEGRQIDHPSLLQETRARMKIMLIDPEQDMPVKKIRQVLNLCVGLVKKR